MAARLAVTAFLFVAFALSQLELSACADIVRAKVSCLDCRDQRFNLSGIKIMVKCEKEKKLSMATTQHDGSFVAELPTSRSSDCLVQILGGSQQFYASGNTMVSQIVESNDENDSRQSYYTTSTPLAISTSCPKEKNCRGAKAVGSSKTIDLPLPKRMGLGTIKLLPALCPHHRDPLN